MKKSFRRRAAWVPIMATAVGASLLTMTPARAALGTNEIAVTAGGSDTTDKLLADIFPAFNNSTMTIGGVTKTLKTRNIPALPAVGATFNVQGDSECTDVNWVRDPAAPAASTAATKSYAPFGSSSGRNYLVAEHLGTGPNPPAPAPPTPTSTDYGCIDIARSSAGPRNGATGTTNGADRASFEYYAFALDAMSWGTTSIKAPAVLTRQQITDIYDCVITNWGQVGGVPGEIRRYVPQAGSGTRGFFTSDLLVGKSSSYIPPTIAQNGSCPSEAVYGEENFGKGILDADIDKAIMPYSAAVWSFQEENRINPTLDLRKGLRLGGVKTTATVNPPADTTASMVKWNGGDRNYSLDTAGVVKESNSSLVNSNPSFGSIRLVFNVLDRSNIPATTDLRLGYQGAFNLVGFDNVAGGFKSPLCSVDPDAPDPRASTAYFAILSNGYVPLDTSNINGKNAAGSHCRLYTPVNVPA